MRMSIARYDALCRPLINGLLASVVVPVPPSVNNLFATARHGKRFPTKEYEAWRAVAIPILMGLAPAASYPVRAVFTVIDKLRKGRDIDNLNKALLDAAVAAGVIEDDCWSFVEGVFITYAPEPRGAGVRVSFEEVDHAG